MADTQGPALEMCRELSAEVEKFGSSFFAYLCLGPPRIDLQFSPRSHGEHRDLWVCHSEPPALAV